MDLELNSSESPKGPLLSLRSQKRVNRIYKGKESDGVQRLNSYDNSYEFPNFRVTSNSSSVKIFKQFGHGVEKMFSEWAFFDILGVQSVLIGGVDVSQSPFSDERITLFAVFDEFIARMSIDESGKKAGRPEVNMFRFLVQDHQ